ncbi:hypothetical protein PENTCL1PPCAC_12656 [Pristionchus entomophagus]|uniref:Uncharacterized protein n=1 Tax=Pristionchus entomophagus TaxID=358040 RepID=A0AAV5T4P6_9BILA|nr:hypothetical protein PENTCL1PPCAC_12656 [Pristionchus entomophagus]
MKEKEKRYPSPFYPSIPLDVFLLPHYPFRSGRCGLAVCSTGPTAAGGVPGKCCCCCRRRGDVAALPGGARDGFLQSCCQTRHSLCAREEGLRLHQIRKEERSRKRAVVPLPVRRAVKSSPDPQSDVQAIPHLRPEPPFPPPRYRNPR